MAFTKEPSVTTFGFIISVCLSVRIEHLVSQGKIYMKFYTWNFYEVVHTFRVFVKINEIGKNGGRNTLYEALHTVHHVAVTSSYDREKVLAECMS